MEILNTNVGGIYLWVYMLLIPASLIILWLANNWWETRQAIQKCGGNRLLCLFHTKGGQGYFKWCLDEGGELTPADMKGYNKDARDLATKAIGKIKAEKQEFGWYAVLPDHIVNVPYPLLSKNPKAMARVTEYVEDYPMPRVTSNLATWNAKEYSEVCSAMAEAAKDTGDIRAIISEAAGIEEKLGSLLDIPQLIASMKLWQYIAVGEGAINLILAYMIFDKTGKIAAQYGISALLQFLGIGG